jgi:hypothetical protein
VIVAVLSVLAGVRATILAGIAVRAIVAGGSRNSRWRPSRRRRARCCQGGRRANPSHEQPSQRQNLRSVQSQSCHHVPFICRSGAGRCARAPASSRRAAIQFPLASHLLDGQREHERPKSSTGYTVGPNPGLSVERIAPVGDRVAVFACVIETLPRLVASHDPSQVAAGVGYLQWQGEIDLGTELKRLRSGTD